jgi:hypothetical protein
MAASESDVLKKIELASAKIERVTGHIVHAVELHEANRFVTYSPHLSDQIPTSYAANAFNTFQDTMFRHEIIRICAIWDSSRSGDLEMESIRAIAQLIGDSETIHALVENQRKNTLDRPWKILGPDRDTKAMDDSIRKMIKGQADSAAELCNKYIQRSLFQSSKIINGERLASLRNIRNKHLAHSLSKTIWESKGPVKKPKYGYETHLLLRSILIADWLYLAICNSSFDWKGAIEIAKKKC